MRGRKYNSHGPTSFLKNTYKLLSNESLNNIIRWTEDGGSFVIDDLFSFTNTVLPKYFKHSNLASFIRQLNMYGFHKTKDGIQGLQFSHPLFHRDKKVLLKEIHRKSSDSAGYLNKEDISVLGERLQKFQSQQHNMEAMLELLENQYSEVLEKNQVLISELFQSKQREKQIELFLQSFTQQTKEEVQNMEENAHSSLLWNMEPQYPGEERSEEDQDKVSQDFKDDYSND
jgi:HSF-type DNA-binding